MDGLFQALLLEHHLPLIAQLLKLFLLHGGRYDLVMSGDKVYKVSGSYYISLASVATQACYMTPHLALVFATLFYACRGARGPIPIFRLTSTQHSTVWLTLSTWETYSRDAI